MACEFLGETLESNVLANSLEYAKKRGISHNDVVGKLKSLEAKGVATLTALEPVASYEILDAGREYMEHGSPEIRIVAHLLRHGAVHTQAELAALDAGGVGFKECMRLKWISFSKSPPLIQAVVTAVPADELAAALRAMDFRDIKLLQVLKKRGLLTERKVTPFRAELRTGPIVVLRQELTQEMLASGSWKQEQFKPANLASFGKPQVRGHLHPLMKVRAQYRSIFLEMGFEEMPTNNFVESSFWNFDALFQAQQHPARDSHDTFFLSQPRLTRTLPADYMARVKDVHERGGYGSFGYRYTWREEEARLNVLRTHTTAVSTRMLYKLAQECANGAPFTPKKYFSIDRVFRHEATDPTHLAEFHQMEGLVCDRGLGLSDLMGVIGAFFCKARADGPCVQACVQPVHGAEPRNFCFQPHLQPIHRDRQQWSVPSGDVAAYGASGRRVCYCLGTFSGEADDANVRLQGHPRPLRQRRRHPSHKHQPHLSCVVMLSCAEREWEI
eukprot:gnl/Spiro4/13351_TR7105_c0_g1_i1.p1 gnl/Spiro4/13351_TR7105_c0_g1~~gnl/Spiro4/13351_TR7105_c0_g1_i1.p1  ORF type:complete len:512 (+),score=90.26 gnl/Spiro4/13351_TR7105_c0_g1_i1:39-1538(+)